MRVYMQTPPGPDGPPRFYQLILTRDLVDGWTLIREWGQAGSPGRSKRDHFPDYSSAAQALERLREAQIRRGYRTMFIEGESGPP